MTKLKRRQAPNHIARFRHAMPDRYRTISFSSESRPIPRLQPHPKAAGLGSNTITAHTIFDSYHQNSAVVRNALQAASERHHVRHDDPGPAHVQQAGSIAAVARNCLFSSSTRGLDGAGLYPPHRAKSAGRFGLSCGAGTGLCLMRILSIARERS